MSRLRKFFGVFQRVAMAVVGVFVSDSSDAGVCPAGQYLDCFGSSVSGCLSSCVCSVCSSFASFCVGSMCDSDGFLGPSCFQSGLQIMCSEFQSITTGGTTNISGVLYNSVTSGYANSGGRRYIEYGQDIESATPVVPSVASDCDITGLTCASGYTSVTKASAQTALASVANMAGTSYIHNPISRAPAFCVGSYCDFSSAVCDSTTKPLDTALITLAHNGLAPGEFETTFDNFMAVRGRAKCSLTSGTSGNPGSPSDSLGSYCWCKITRVKDKNGTSGTSDDKWLPVYSDWVPSGSGSFSGSVFNPYSISSNSKYNDNYKCLRGCSELCASMSVGMMGSGTGILSTMISTNAIHQFACEAPSLAIITLNRNGGTDGTASLYPTANGVYLDSSHSTLMATSGTATRITKPTKTGWSFTGYFNANSSSATSYINSSGNITSAGITAGTGTTNKEWIAIWKKSTKCAAGSYWNGSDCTSFCTSNGTSTGTTGYYCTGGDVYSYTASGTGRGTCPSSYPSSTISAAGNFDCYTSCPTTMDHATGTVTGNLYSGGGSTCQPSGCESGYKVVGLPGRVVISASSTNYCAVYALGSDGTGGFGLYGNNCAGDTAAAYGLDSGQWAYDANRNGDPVMVGEGRFSSATDDVVSDSTMQGTSTTGSNCYCRIIGMKYFVTPNNISSLYSKNSQWVRLGAPGTGISGCAEACGKAILGGNGSGDGIFKELLAKYMPSTKMCVVAGVNCAAGTYLKKNTSTCSTCAKGYYCSGGTFEFNISVSQGITACPAGSYCPAGVSAPISCSTLGGGLYTNSAAKATAATGCYITIAASKYLSSPSETSLADCTAGYYCAGGDFHYSSSATNQGRTGVCDANTYSTGGATAATCTACPDGMVTTGTSAGYHNAKSDCKVTCSAGEFLRKNNSACETCVSGYYCPGGTYGYKTSNQGVTQCAAGTYCPAGASEETQCTGNTYSLAGAASCTACPTGYTISGTAIEDHDESSDCVAPVMIDIKWYGVSSSATLNNGEALSSCDSGDPSHCKKSSVIYAGNIVTPSKGASATGQNFLGWKFIK